MATQTDSFRIPLPRGWSGRVTSAVLHVISLAQHAMAYTRSWAANCHIARLGLTPLCSRQCRAPCYTSGIRSSPDARPNENLTRHARCVT